MCGIYFCLGNINCTNFYNNKPRGPDTCQTIKTAEYTAVFYRLAIVGVENGMQPFEYDDMLFLCNGEIYNNTKLEEEYKLECKTKSDCECIMRLYRKVGIDKAVMLLDGEFAFVLYDKKENKIFFARDRFGRKPLFYHFDEENIDISSLYSGLNKQSENSKQVEPRHLYTYDINTKKLNIKKYHIFRYVETDVTHDQIYYALKEAVIKRIHHSEKPVGFLLSGGFDSSLVLSIALEYYYEEYIKEVNRLCPDGGHFRDIEYAYTIADKTRIKPLVFTFAFTASAPDMISASIMVEWLKKKYGDNSFKWLPIVSPLSLGLGYIDRVIGALETYDTTTIRASVPMYIISEYIKMKTDVKVIISGEGSDELFGGYLYFMYAKSDDEFRSEIIKLLNELYLFDVLRCDRATAAHGLEVRTPFLDDKLVELVLSSKDLVRNKFKSKELIRTIVENRNLLPLEILHRKKDAFSDAVGYSWKDSIEEYARDREYVSRSDGSDNGSTLVSSSDIIPNTHETKMYQHVFGKLFNNSWHLLPHLWLPNQSWVNTGMEPSARVLDIYSEKN